MGHSGHSYVGGVKSGGSRLIQYYSILVFDPHHQDFFTMINPDRREKLRLLSTIEAAL